METVGDDRDMQDGGIARFFHDGSVRTECG